MRLDGFFFSGSIPPVFEHKVRCHQQRFGKMTATAGLDKYKKLLWTRLQWHQSCHSNEMASSSILLAAVFLGIGTFFQHRSQEFFPPIAASDVREVWAKYVGALPRYSGIEVTFSGLKYSETGQSWSSTVIFTNGRMWFAKMDTFHN